ncbi:hypothetical protein M9H77_29471 [Catharanthus roseus]|uniref:Uncharacterized protein n=1 Tax=Catharanthus roseus TaxID=4058 RepID=A0ACB9ZUU2_CATRO|nr:hypothetical protein M9H77_29471 [Catharanthus roseus]
MHSIARDKICRPREEGGLVVSNLRRLKLVYMAKLGINLGPSSSGWVFVVDCKHWKGASHGIWLERLDGAQGAFRGTKTLLFSKLQLEEVKEASSEGFEASTPKEVKDTPTVDGRSTLPSPVGFWVRKTNHKPTYRARRSRPTITGVNVIIMYGIRTIEENMMNTMKAIIMVPILSNVKKTYSIERDGLKSTLKSLSPTQVTEDLKKLKERMQGEREPPKGVEMVICGGEIKITHGVLSHVLNKDECSKEKENDLEENDRTKKMSEVKRENSKEELNVFEKSEDLNFFVNQIISSLVSEIPFLQNFGEPKHGDHFTFLNSLGTYLERKYFIEFNSIPCAIPRVDEYDFNIANYLSCVLGVENRGSMEKELGPILKDLSEFSPTCLHHNINERKEAYHGVQREKRKCWRNTNLMLWGFDNELFFKPFPLLPCVFLQRVKIVLRIECLLRDFGGELYG